MASYEAEHSSYAQEEAERRQKQRQGSTSNRLDRSEPMLASFFSAERLEPTPASFSALASALRQHLGGESQVMETMIRQLILEAEGDVDGNGGVDQLFLDSLDRVPKGAIKADDSCSICATPYLEDKYPLIVQLRCRHQFDLECITPWLKLHTTCPMCRADVQAAKQIIVDDSEEEYDNTYG